MWRCSAPQNYKLRIPQVYNRYMNGLYQFLSTPLAKFLILPIATIVLGNIFKLLCQDTNMKSPWRNYFYWGPNAIVAAFLLSFVDICNRISSAPVYNGCITLGVDFLYRFILVLLIFVSVPIAMATLLHKYGWEKVEYGYRIRLWRGIILSDVLGFFVLYIVSSLLK